MSRTERSTSPWWLAFALALALGTAAAAIQLLADRPAWSPRPDVQPAAASLQSSALGTSAMPTAQTAQHGWWSIEGGADGLRLVYHP